MFGRKKVMKINEASFDQKAIKINGMVNYDQLFDALEHAMTESEYIVVDGGMHDYGVEQVIMTFLDRYKMFVESYYIDLRVQHGKSYIKLKSKRSVASNYGYSDLEAFYSEEYYLNDCGGYEDFKKSDGKMIDQRLQDIFYLINPCEGDKILDVGCGRGELTYALAESGADATGVDYSEAAIKIATKTYRGGVKLKYVHEDIFQMEDLDTFDKIVMADVVEHIEQDVLEKIFERISKSLSKSGVLIVHTAPNKDYYEIIYPELRRQAAAIGHYLPQNPRTYYEQLMHINEQSPRGLQTVLEKYFSYVRVWTGMVEEIGVVKTVDENHHDNQIFAYACNNKNVLNNIIKEISGSDEKPEEEFCEVCIEAENFKVLNDMEGYIDVYLENIGKEMITSRRKYPIYLAYHILSKNGEMLLFEGERTKITEVIRKGKKKRMKMKISIPEEIKRNMQYTVTITCVAEGLFWLDAKGKNKKDVVMTLE